MPIKVIKNTVLFKEGDPNKYIYLVRSGEFEVFKKVIVPKLDDQSDEFQKIFDDPLKCKDQFKRNDLKVEKMGVHIIGKIGTC